MTYNLFIAYDLILPGQNYGKVKSAIESLGNWHKFQQSLYYLNTQHNPNAVFSYIASVMDTNDKLAVINAQSGVVSNWDNPPIDAINTIWHAA